MSAVLAPGGWGFVPGWPLTGEAVLPDLGDPGWLSNTAKNAAITDALRQVQGLERVRVRDVKHKYHLSDSTASVVLARAKSF